MKYRWIERAIDRPEAVVRLQKGLNGLPEALARTLVLRGVEGLDTARRFFRPSREDLHDPFLMADMDRAAPRVAEAIRRGERVLVYGDYDVDGTTAAALMTHFLRERGAAAGTFIPDRFEHGYGLCKAGLDQALEQDASLVIALDCGITAREQAAYARSKGLDLIICDHHTAPDELPDALAVLDPKRPDCDYPFPELSGCGVGFKLVQAVLDRLGDAPEQAFAYGDLLAVSIASDIVPIGGENRVLMREGLKVLRRRPRLGLKKLSDRAGLDLSTLTSGRIAFTLGPRINAAGRLDHAGQAVDLLLAERAPEAERLADALEALNERRRAIDRETTEAALQKAERQFTARTPHALVLDDPEWHPGVIGIVASSVVERLHRPTIMMTAAGDGLLKGSARSISGVNVYEALSACEPLLEQFGGHTHAAGLSIRKENLEAFRTRFDEAVGEQVTPELLLPALKVDASLNIDTIGTHRDRFWAVLKQFAPFGPSNAKPVFRATNLTLARPPRTVGSDDKHLKFTARLNGSANGRSGMDAIGFGLGEKIDVLRQSRREGRPFELLFSVEENTWRGRTSLQLKARDLRLQD